MNRYTIFVPLYNVIICLAAQNKHIAYSYAKHLFNLIDTDKVTLVGTNIQ